MLHAGVGQQALDIVLYQQKRYRHGDGEQAERQQQVGEKSGPNVRTARRMVAQDRVDRAVQQHGGERGADRRRRLAVGVGQPGMHRRQSGFGAEANQDKREGEAHQVRVQSAATARKVAQSSAPLPGPTTCTAE